MYRCPDCAESFPSRYTLALHVKVHASAPVVLNRRDFPGGLPPNSVYCGRGTFTGNPYRIGVDGDRDEVIDRYIAERRQDDAFLALVRRRLKGRNLVCHCAPERCHCDWLLVIANS